MADDTPRMILYVLVRAILFCVLVFFFYPRLRPVSAWTWISKKWNERVGKTRNRAEKNYGGNFFFFFFYYQSPPDCQMKRIFLVEYHCLPTFIIHLFFDFIAAVRSLLYLTMCWGNRRFLGKSARCCCVRVQKNCVRYCYVGYPILYIFNKNMSLVEGGEGENQPWQIRNEQSCAGHISPFPGFTHTHNDNKKRSW